MGRPVVHFEVGVTDGDRAHGFYRELFDWTVRADDRPYGLVETGSDDGIGGGIFRVPPGVDPYVTFYVEVPDLLEALDRAEHLGGKTVTEPMQVGDIGSFAMFADPDGNVIGLFEERADA